MALWTQEDVDTLKAAIASGILTVTYAGPPARSITYQSLADMRNLLSEMVRDVASQSSATAPTRVRRAQWDQGFGRSGRRGWRVND